MKQGRAVRMGCWRDTEFFCRLRCVVGWTVCGVFAVSALSECGGVSVPAAAQLWVWPVPAASALQPAAAAASHVAALPLPTHPAGALHALPALTPPCTHRAHAAGSAGWPSGCCLWPTEQHEHGHGVFSQLLPHVHIHQAGPQPQCCAIQ